MATRLLRCALFGFFALILLTPAWAREDGAEWTPAEAARRSAGFSACDSTHEECEAACRVANPSGSYPCRDRCKSAKRQCYKDTDAVGETPAVAARRAEWSACKSADEDCLGTCTKLGGNHPGYLSCRLRCSAETRNCYAASTAASIARGDDKESALAMLKSMNDSSVCTDTKRTCNAACDPNLSACGERCQASFEECEWLAKFGPPKNAEHAADVAEMRAVREADVAKAEKLDAERLARDQKQKEKDRAYHEDMDRERREAPEKLRQAVQATQDSVNATSDAFARMRAQEAASNQKAIDAQKIVAQQQQAQAAAENDRRASALKESNRKAEEERVRVADATRKQQALRDGCPRWTGAYNVFSGMQLDLELDFSLVEACGPARSDWHTMRSEIATQLNGPSTKKWGEFVQQSKDFARWSDKATLGCTGLSARCGGSPSYLNGGAVNVDCRNYENNQLCLQALKALIGDAERSNTYAVCAQGYVEEFRSAPH